MLFSIDYKIKEALKDAEEVRVPVNQLGTIPSYPEKRYNIYYTSDEQRTKIPSQIQLLQKRGISSFTVQANTTKDFHYFKKLNIPNYIPVIATDWEFFNFLRREVVSDIIIGGPLAFQMDAISAAKGNIKIRIQPWSQPLTPDVRAFFIRPEDLPIYSAIDIIELPQKSYLSIYQRGSFEYNISNLFPFLPSVNNKYVTEELGKMRANCAQKCLHPNHVCNYCENYFNAIVNSLRLVNKKDAVDGNSGRGN